MTSKGNPIVQTRVDPATANAIEAKAKQAGQSKAEWIRDTLTAAATGRAPTANRVTVTRPRRATTTHATGCTCLVCQ